MRTYTQYRSRGHTHVHRDHANIHTYIQYMHTYLSYAHTHTYIHTYTHTYAHKYTRACMHHEYIRTYIHTYNDTHVQTCAQVILLDVMMPNISGIDLCQILRQMYDLIELPIVMLSAQVCFMCIHTRLNIWTLGSKACKYAYIHTWRA
jgi:CheY-like chemotaxis protein